MKKLNIQYGQRTDKGKVRSENQDSICVINSPSNHLEVDGVIAVADGMGGHKGGAVASKIAIDCLKESIQNYNPEDNIAV